MPTITIQATLLTCASPIKANPGDQLTVLNNAVIGVYDSSKIQSPKDSFPIPPTEADILQVIKEAEGPISGKAIAKALQVSPQAKVTFNTIMKRLRRAGLLHKIEGDSRMGFYVHKEDSNEPGS